MKQGKFVLIGVILLSYVGLLFFFILSPLQAAEPLVDTDWLLANLNNPKLVVLDLQPKATYRRFHVPGAVNIDYADWRKPDSSIEPRNSR